MSEESDKKASEGGINWGSAATIAAGAAIGSAALAAALIFATKRKSKPTDTPLHPEDAPETD